MKENFFKTLSEALDAVRAYLVDSKAVLADAEDFFYPFTFGGVNYGQTVRRAGLLSEYRGKPIVGRMAKRGLTLNVYRMDSGTYEAVCYIA
jgi:hypothetical protein